MITVRQALKTKFDATPALIAAVPDGLWTEEIPEAIDTYPFVALLGLEEIPLYTAEAAYLEQGTYQFLVAQAGAAETEEVANAVKAAFDPTTTNVTAGLAFDGTDAAVHVLRTGYQLPTEHTRDSAGEIIYLAVVQYEVMVQRTRA